MSGWNDFTTVIINGKTYVEVPESIWDRIKEGINNLHISLVIAGRVKTGALVLREAELYMLDLQDENRELKGKVKSLKKLVQCCSDFNGMSWDEIAEQAKKYCS